VGYGENIQELSEHPRKDPRLNQEDYRQLKVGPRPKGTTTRQQAKLAFKKARDKGKNVPSCEKKEKLQEGRDNQKKREVSEGASSRRNPFLMP